MPRVQIPGPLYQVREEVQKLAAEYVQEAMDGEDDDILLRTDLVGRRADFVRYLCASWDINPGDLQ